jgi:hypothetical protein
MMKRVTTRMATRMTMIGLLGRNRPRSLKANMHAVEPASAAMVDIHLPATTMAPQRARGAQELSSGIYGARGGGSDLEAPGLEDNRGD